MGTIPNSERLTSVMLLPGPQAGEMWGPGSAVACQLCSKPWGHGSLQQGEASCGHQAQLTCFLCWLPLCTAHMLRVLAAVL